MGMFFLFLKDESEKIESVKSFTTTERHADDGIEGIMISTSNEH